MNNMEAPAFQFYASDFMGSTGEWTDEEVGRYMRLLCHEWMNGSIDCDPARHVNGGTKAEIWAVIKIKFNNDGNDRLVNKRLEGVRQEQHEYRLRKSEAGKAGAKARWQPQSAGNADANGKHDGKDMALQSSPSPPTPTAPSKNTFDQNEFDRFWFAYPKKRRVGKVDCVKWFKSNKPDNVDQMITTIEAFKQCEQWQNVSLIPHPIRWLRRGGWDDEVPAGELTAKELERQRANAR